MTPLVQPSRHYSRQIRRFMYAVIVLVVFQFVALEQGECAKNSVPKKNYLRSVILQSTGLEKDFLIALEAQQNIDLLLESLGLIQVEKKVPFGTAQAPGKAPVQLQTDEGETAAINFRKRLVWHKAFNESHQARQLLIFDPSIKKWPSMQPITIVLVDDKLKLLAWVESGGVPMFEKAVLETDRTPLILKAMSENRDGTHVTEQFEIKERTIEKVRQNIGASHEGDHCGDTHLTAGETDTLMRATALINREKGDTNQPSVQWLAFQKHIKFGETAKPQIQGLLDKGTPAGRLYGAILLKQIDPPSAGLTLNKMKEDNTPVDYIVGCGVDSTTVGALARRIMKGEELVRLRN